jgi:hypothetical protein
MSITTFHRVHPTMALNAIYGFLSPLRPSKDHLLVERCRWARRRALRSQQLLMPVASVNLLLGLMLDALFGLTVHAVVLDVAIDRPTDGGLHDALKEDLVHLIGGLGVAALLALHLKRGGNGHL